MTTIRNIDPRRLLGVRIAFGAGEDRTARRSKARKVLGARIGEKPMVRLSVKLGAKPGSKPDLGAMPLHPGKSRRLGAKIGTKA